MIKELTDLLMPRHCLVCGAQLGRWERHICLPCAASLPLTYYWEQVHNPMADQINALLERTRPEGFRMAYVQAAALLFYHHENPYKLIPQAIKYKGDTRAGEWFGALLGEKLRAQPHFADVDLVAPVPLHWLRQWERGYNQAAVLSAAIARSLGAAHAPQLLARRRRTRSQTRLSASEREKNVATVFRIKKAPRELPRHILLVDDTFTTGATLAACYRVVREVLGPGVRISVATLAAVHA